MLAHTSEADTYKIEANHYVMIQVTGYNIIFTITIDFCTIK